MKITNQLHIHRGGGYTTKQAAFTLIELLVVIAIIGILAGVVIASLNSARAKAADASVKSNLNAIRSQAELYYDAFGSYASLGGAYYQGDCITTRSVLRDSENRPLSDPITNAINAAYQATGEIEKHCRLSQSRQEYAVFVRLKASSGYWCVDSSGVAREVTSLPTGEVARCI